MIEQNVQKNQLPNEIKPAFKELKVLQHLKTAGFKKKFGFTCSFLFQLVFVLLFHHKNWFRLLESEKAESFPGKDAVYRFLNHSGYAWRRFLSLLSASTINKIQPLTGVNRVSVFVIDDSMFERNRSKAVELLSRFKDHATGCYYKGFRMLTLGWSDGHTFIPVDFSLLASIKSQVNGIMQAIDKRTSGYKRRVEALLPAPEVFPAMIDRALSAGVQASYVLMDSWFTHAPLIQAMLDRGLDVIGMVKADKKRYLVGGRRLSLQELYFEAIPVLGKSKGILRSIRTELSPGITVTMVFVRHRSKKKEWLAILCTDCTLPEEEIIRIYGIRWDIEVFFKCAKSLLRLQKEFQGRSYDLLISHTTIVFSRYILLAWQHRQSTDNRTLGGLFHLLCDEVSQLDWAIALRQLIELIEDVAKKTSKKITTLIQTQLQQWIAGLPSYIKAYLPISGCES
ncbi:transposase [Paenibacillus darwinianus]|uniref:Transposase n=1 Tax=Paenibacillus darwinianus TaxID=1380763 RepID=A0A9W5W8F7_9BACL|nr:transposase [Paenibacillus darwinianus]EXX90864.1 transposase [Paenibacillus darwinianus]EXX90917.1 transposase [Paenibacillus darwinianus]